MPTSNTPPILPDDLLAAPVRAFLAATAARTPTPGGGSVAALTGALSAALAQMALQYTLGKKKYEAHAAAIAAALGQLQKASDLLAALVAEDVAAYAALSVFLKMPAAQRDQDPAYPSALAAAIRIPQSTGGLGLHILELCQELREKTNPLLLSDLAIAATLAHATVHASELNVLINLGLLPEKTEAARLRQELRSLSDKADRIYADIRSFVCESIARE